jgi:hypothetical protein
VDPWITEVVYCGFINNSYMKTIFTIDKLILRYNWEEQSRLDNFYLNKFYPKYNNQYIFGNKISAYQIDSSKHKEIADSKLKLCVEYNKEEIGILYLDCSEQSTFYFKISKHIFYEKKYSYKQIIGLVDSFFNGEYHPSGITTMEIALDTVQDTANELFVIADLCIHNNYFKSLSESESLKETSKKLEGREINDAKYSVTMPNLSIGTSKTIIGGTDIGKHGSNSYIRCYNKSNKMEDYQKRYFDQIFGLNQSVYRLEVSLKSPAIKKLDIDINELDSPIYLKNIYFKVCKQKLTFNILDKPMKVDGKIKYDQICLLDSLDFGEFSDSQPPQVNSDLDSFNIVLKKNVFRNNVKRNRAIISKKIGSYFRQNGNEDILEEVASLIKENSLDFKSSLINLDYNIQIADQFAVRHLGQNHSRIGGELYNQLKKQLIESKFSQPIKFQTKLVHKVAKEKFKLNNEDHIVGFHLKKVEVKVDLFSVSK